VMKRLTGDVLIAMFLVYIGGMVCCYAVSFDSSQISPDLHRAFCDVIPHLMDKRLAETCLGMLRYGLLRRVERGRYVATEPLRPHQP
jgi:hypothetical protein